MTCTSLVNLEQTHHTLLTNVFQTLKMYFMDAVILKRSFIVHQYFYKLDFGQVIVAIKKQIRDRSKHKATSYFVIKLK